MLLQQYIVYVIIMFKGLTWMNVIMTRLSNEENKNSSIEMDWDQLRGKETIECKQQANRHCQKVNGLPKESIIPFVIIDQFKILYNN